MSIADRKPPHPGKIRILDGTTNEVLQELDANELPDAVRYARTPEGWEAVTHIVEIQAGSLVRWRAFSKGGKFLKSGTSVVDDA